MANNAYVIGCGIQANILDMAGNAGPGAAVIYSCVVLTPQNQPVPFVPGALGCFNVINRPVQFSVGHNDTTAGIQAAVTADVRSLYNDPTLNVVFL